MAANNSYVISLDTGKQISNAEFARTFLSNWLDINDPVPRPETWDFGEPVKKQISDTTFEDLVAGWCKSPLIFKRRAKPKMAVAVDWRHSKGLDPRPYPWGLLSFLGRNAGDRAAEALFRFFIDNLSPAFASLTVYSDREAKHYGTWPIHTEDNTVTGSAFCGTSILHTFPGIYWMTYFGDEIANSIRDNAFMSLPSGYAERLNNGWLVIAYEPASSIGSVEGWSAEVALRNHFGASLFFDKASVKHL